MGFRCGLVARNRLNTHRNEFCLANCWWRIVGFGGGNPSEIGSDTGVDTSVIGILLTGITPRNNAHLYSIDENRATIVTLHVHNKSLNMYIHLQMKYSETHVAKSCSRWSGCAHHVSADERRTILSRTKRIVANFDAGF
jgi:hypothetical protein